VTRVPDMPSVDDALSSCGDAERAAIADVANRSYLAVRNHLLRQDEVLGVEWAQLWEPPRAVTPSE
jgi:hypothetical protein